MTRNGTVAAIALCATVVGMGLAGCDEAPDPQPPATTTSAGTPAKKDDAFTGTKKIKIDSHSVNVSCSGTGAADRPVIVLMLGAGDGLKEMADLQKTLSEKDRVCSYDRLGAGDSDQPDGPQTVQDIGRVLTGVIANVAGDAPVVLAGHSLGGLLAGRYAPDHQDRVKGVVLMDATSPTQTADLQAAIPDSAAGPVVKLKTDTIAQLQGQNPEKLATPDGPVASAGDIPVEVIQHGKQYLAAADPTYGQAMEQAWAAGQQQWLGLSGKSDLITAKDSEHYIYKEAPDVAVQAIQKVADGVAEGLS